jgi:hypothetical protein
MLSKLFGVKGRGFLFSFLIDLGKELIEELPLPLLSKLADGRLTKKEIKELIVIIGGEAALVFERNYRETYGEPEEEELNG